MTMTRTSTTLTQVYPQPLVKWVGGKRQLLSEIYKYLPKDIGTYYEPFVGGGALLFGITPSKAIINDYNEELINLYEVIKDNPDGLMKSLDTHKINHSEDHYYKVRQLDRIYKPEEFKLQVSPVERASRFVYLNKTGFNGLFRVNRKGQINVPFGHYTTIPTLYITENIQAMSKYLNGSVTITQGDYRESLKTTLITPTQKGIIDTKTTFVYLDPPYASADDSLTNPEAIKDASKGFVGYTDKGFDVQAQVRLRDTFNELTRLGVRAMLSNASVPVIHELYAAYASTTKIVKARRSVNSNGNGRGKVDEVLIMNYDPNTDTNELP